MNNQEIISFLNLPAALGAQTLLIKCPDAILTSGRRNLVEQAHDMAVDQALDAKFILKTYAESPVKDACLAAVAGLTDEASIEQALVAALQPFSDEELQELSAHLGGNAFDVHVDGDQKKIDALRGIVADHIASGGQGRFLTRESQLQRWHVQLT
jgi:hypothetical protein